MSWVTILAALCADVELCAMLTLSILESRKYSKDQNTAGWVAVAAMAVMAVVLTLALLQTMGAVYL